MSRLEAGVAGIPTVEIFYDGSCAVCRASRRWLERRDREGRFRFVDSCALPPGDPCPVPPELLATSVWVRLPGDRFAGGYDGLTAAVAALPRWRALATPATWAPVRALGRAVYRVVARHRHLLGRA